MRPNSLKNLIKARYKAAYVDKTTVLGYVRPLHVESSPGLGKSQIVAQAAKELAIGFKKVDVPLLQPEDWAFPIVSKDKDNVTFIVSRDKFPLEGTECPEHGILFFDELSQGDNANQKIVAQFIQERELHGQRIKPGWMIISAGNRTVDRSGASRLLSHLSNRMTRLELECSIDDWTQWALVNGVKPEVIGFLRFKPSLLSAFDSQQETNPTPRSWSEGVSADLGIVSKTEEMEVFKGSVGEAAAAEFTAFLQIYRDLPNPDVILLSPATAPCPTDKPSVMYALCLCLEGKTTGQNFDRVMTYVSRMPREFAALFVKSVTHKKPDLANTQTFIKWATDNQDLLT